MVAPGRWIPQYQLITGGARVERRGADGETRHEIAWLIDFEDLNRNDFVVVNQLSVEEGKRARRPDVVAYVNGLPLGLIELKVPGEERATLRGAWNQLRTYALEIPSLLTYTAVSVISTGTQARMGALGGAFEHYAPWKTIDGRSLAVTGRANAATRGRVKTGHLRSGMIVASAGRGGQLISL